MSGIELSRRDIEDALAHVGRMRDGARGMAKQGSYVVGTIAGQVESAFAAGSYGVVLGRYGEVRIGPAPADLLAAFGLHVAGFLGAFGDHAGHAHNFAQGLLDGYVQRLGIGLGARMMQASKAPAAAPGAPATPQVAGVRRAARSPSYRFGQAPDALTVADLVQMADAQK